MWTVRSGRHIGLLSLAGLISACGGGTGTDGPDTRDTQGSAPVISPAIELGAENNTALEGYGTEGRSLSSGPENGLILSGVTVAGLDQLRPAAAFSGVDFMIVWADNRSGASFDIFAARVDATGMMIDGASIPITRAEGDQIEPAIAFNGAEYLVVWADGREGELDVFGRRLAINGELVGGEIPIAAGIGDQRAPDVAAQSATFFVVWEDHATGMEHLAYGRVDEEGFPLDDNKGIELMPGERRQMQPAIACGHAGTDCLVAFEHEVEAGMDLMAARLTIEGPQLLAISAPGGLNLTPDVALDGTNYMVAWVRDGAIHQNRVKLGTGTILGEAAVDTFLSNKASPAIAFDGARYLIVWADDRLSPAEDIFGSRVIAESGVPADRTARLLLAASGRQQFPALAFGGGAFLIAEEDRRGERPDIYATRVGSPTTTGAAIALSGVRRVSPEAAFDGSNYFVVLAKAYFKGRGAGNTNYISAVRMSPTGAVNQIDVNGGRAISQGIYTAEKPDVAHNSITHQFLVVWAEHNGVDFDIFGARVTDASAGPPLYAVLDTIPIPIAIGAGNQTAPAVAWSSLYNRYLVAFEDDTAYLRDIRGVRVAYDGVVLDPVSFAIAQAPYEQREPDVASTGASFQVVWTDGRCGLPNCEDLFTAAVGNTGAVSANIPLIARPNKQYAPRIAASGTTDYAVVWVDERAGLGNGDIYGRKIGASGTPVPPSAGLLLAGGELDQNEPVLVALGSTWFVTYREQSAAGSERYDLFGMRRGGTLQAVVDAPFLISAGAFSEDEPAIAIDSELGALVMYHRYDEEPNIRAQRAFGRRVSFGD